ncbi:GGDEF domain-containing protein [Deinococcus humi]|uniref:Diguanylate cyclase (GGDEF)-like protein n=1 Tax=Deinococcus humi TaxID=662880 RepID=A0A7W8NGY6_9DEIO|nr:GGDEF domain-containing protein [Deinococcus humi]MBB5365280.1 diguanylate cyclase (GGDEF)-like protein [Deinococcus humi]GGO35890.1 GGDEF domain-containing protein [Deinococcus humi]
MRPAQPPRSALDAIDPARLLLWIPLLAALTGAVILITLDLAATLYLGILAAIMLYTGLALFGPPRLRALLLNHAPLSYAAVLLMAWGAALYLLPQHPATAMVRLSVALYLTMVYVFLFAQRPPERATRWAVGVLLTQLIMTLPHAACTLGETGAFDGVTLLFTILFSHGALIVVLRAFSAVRDQLALAEGRIQAAHELAHQDPLTDLPNRRALERDLAHAVTEPSRNWRLAVVDVDGLKSVNDRLGHAAGDDLLRRFAHGFAAGAGPDGQVYRISGDEFALLFGEGQLPAETVVERVTLQIQAVYSVAGASVGATRHRAGESADTWLSRADQAMYRHKRRGGPGR